MIELAALILLILLLLVMRWRVLSIRRRQRELCDESIRQYFASWGVSFYDELAVFPSDARRKKVDHYVDSIRYFLEQDKKEATNDNNQP